MMSCELPVPEQFTEHVHAAERVGELVDGGRGGRQIVKVEVPDLGSCSERPHLVRRPRGAVGVGVEGDPDVHAATTEGNRYRPAYPGVRAGDDRGAWPTGLIFWKRCWVCHG